MAVDGRLLATGVLEPLSEHVAQQTRAGLLQALAKVLPDADAALNVMMRVEPCVSSICANMNRNLNEALLPELQRALHNLCLEQALSAGAGGGSNQDFPTSLGPATTLGPAGSPLNLPMSQGLSASEAFSLAAVSNGLSGGAAAGGFGGAFASAFSPARGGNNNAVSAQFGGGGQQGGLQLGGVFPSNLSLLSASSGLQLQDSPATRPLPGMLGGQAPGSMAAGQAASLLRSPVASITSQQSASQQLQQQQGGGMMMMMPGGSSQGFPSSAAEAAAAGKQMQQQGGFMPMGALSPGAGDKYQRTPMFGGAPGPANAGQRSPMMMPGGGRPLSGPGFMQSDGSGSGGAFDLQQHNNMVNALLVDAASNGGGGPNSSGAMQQQQQQQLPSSSSAGQPGGANRSGMLGSNPGDVVASLMGFSGTYDGSAVVTAGGQSSQGGLAGLEGGLLGLGGGGGGAGVGMGASRGAQGLMLAGAAGGRGLSADGSECIQQQQQQAGKPAGAGFVGAPAGPTDGSAAALQSSSAAAAAAALMAATGAGAATSTCSLASPGTGTSPASSVASSISTPSHSMHTTLAQLTLQQQVAAAAAAVSQAATSGPLPIGAPGGPMSMAAKLQQAVATSPNAASGAHLASPGMRPKMPTGAGVGAGGVASSPGAMASASAAAAAAAMKPPADMPPRFRVLPGPVQAKIHMLTKDNHVVLLKDFDDKVVSKICSLLDKFGVGECLAMLERIEEVLKGKAGRLANGPGYLDVSVSTRIDELKQRAAGQVTAPEDYARSTLHSRIYQELKSLVEGHACLRWDHVDQGIVNILKKMPNNVALERLAELRYHSFKNVDNVKSCMAALLAPPKATRV